MAIFKTSAPALLLACAVAACAGPQVRSLATGEGPPAFELRGQDIVALHDEASRLCVRGYTVLRQSQRFSRPMPADNAAAPWLQHAGDWLSGMPGNAAQATVQCRA